MPRQGKVPALSAVDVFAGGGGLTVGLKRAGFSVVAAVEIEPHAFATYKANHPEVNAYKQDVRTVKGRSLSKLSPNGTIDLLAGCPPCQGFCSLTSRYRRYDPRNDLIKEMSRLVEETKPVAVMIENVPGLADKGRELLDEFLRRLSSLGYVSDWDVLQVADYGVPQSRRRLVVVAGKGFPIELPEPTHSRTPRGGLKPWITIDRIIKGLPEPITLEAAQLKEDLWPSRGMSCEPFPRRINADLEPPDQAGIGAASLNGYARNAIKMEMASVTSTVA